MPENDEDFIDVEIDWQETVSYRSTIRISRESYDEWFEAEVGEHNADHKCAPGWVKEYITAGEETDWFDQCDTAADFTDVIERVIIGAHTEEKQ